MSHIFQISIPRRTVDVRANNAFQKYIINNLLKPRLVDRHNLASTHPNYRIFFFRRRRAEKHQKINPKLVTSINHRAGFMGPGAN